MKVNLVTADLPDFPFQEKNFLDPNDAIIDFMKCLEAYGLIITGLPEATGAIVRVPTKDDTRGKKTGWYILYDGPILAGSYGDFRRDGEGHTWSSVEKSSMSSQQLVEFQNQIRAAKQRREEERLILQGEAAREANAIWNAGMDVRDFSYLTDKKLNGSARISQSSTEYHNGWMMLPLYNEDNQIVSLQFVSETGQKYFLSDGRIQGCYNLINGETDEIYIAEGYATGMTVTMATGKSCAVAWNANNLMAVAENIRNKYPNSVLVIAGDNDHETKIEGSLVNVGFNKATMVAKTLGLNAVFPVCEAGESDFNDVHISKGLEAVRKMIIKDVKTYDNSHNTAYTDMPNNLLNPPAILADIVNYYNATARAPQQGFAVQTALAIGSLICGRYFKTTKNNFTSLYFLNIAKSGTGKEHCKTVMEKVMQAADQQDLISGGYTSSGAIISTLLKQPRHCTIIDEFGLYLKSTSDSGNSNSLEAQTMLMEAFGRQGGILRPKQYSEMTKKQDESKRKIGIASPALTLVGMTTPSTFYESVTGSNVSDGFLGRFIIHQSNVQRAVHDDPDDIPVPTRITDWIKAIQDRVSQPMEMAMEWPDYIELTFDNESLRMIKEFAQFQVDMADSLEQYNLEALPMRIKEMAMKMALIIALAKDPQALIIDSESTSWAIQYVKFSIEQTVKIMKLKVSDSDYEGQKKEILGALRERPEGITTSQAIKQSPFSKYRHKELKIILEELQEAELIDMKAETSGRGRPALKWFAID